MLRPLRMLMILIILLLIFTLAWQHLNGLLILIPREIGSNFSIGKRSWWLGLKEYQVRDKKSLERHFILVLCAYTFILWHKLTGGLRRRWANKPLNTFPEALDAFRTAISYRFIRWLEHNRDVFVAYKASLGYIWAWFLFKSRYLILSLNFFSSN